MTLPPLSTVLGGRHLVVTGCTGFLGKVWLSHLLANVPDVGRISLLVRPPRRGTARDRFAVIADTSPAFRPLKRRHGSDYAAFLDARIDVLDADIGKPGCGLSDDARASLEGADCVIHLAGLTDFHPDPRRGVPANVDGAVHVGELAAALGAKMVHTSTCYVAGLDTGDTPETLERGVSPSGDVFDPWAEREAVKAVIAEHRRPTPRTDAAAARAEALGWPNLYTYTKGLAEHLLADMDLDLTIVRPAVVECARTWPFQGWNEGLNTSAPIMWFCGTSFLTLPSSGDHRFDIIPVDAVARRLTVIVAHHLRGQAERVYQLGTSDHNPTTFARIVELTALGKRRHATSPSGSLRDWVVSQLDVRTSDFDRQHVVNPKRVASWAGRLAERLTTPERAPEPAAELFAKARKTLHRTRRDMGRLERMLDLYQPFIHDNDWVFRTDNTREAMAAVHPDDAAFTDDLSEMCWRTYWLDVQYPGVQKWAFPIVDGETVPEDPPSDPPLALGGPVALREVGAA
jgi:long-chain acyl-CoA synthetase